MSLDLPSFIDQRKLTNAEKARLLLHKKQNPHAWWIPTGAQEEFLLALNRIGTGKSGHKCRTALMLGGNCTGKTATMTNIILGLLLPKVYNPWIAKSTFFTDKSWAHGFARNGQLAILALMKKKVIQTVFTPAMKQWAPLDSYTTERGDAKFDHTWQFKNGGLLRVFTTEQEIGQLEGGNYDAIFTDEHFPYHYRNELKQRLRGKGAWLTFQTPKYSIDSALFIQEIMYMPEDERIVVYLHKESACKTHGVRGWREHSEIREEIKDCDPELYSAVVEGKPMAFAGKVFKQFKYEQNVKPDAEIVDLVKSLGATIYASCDPAEARPNAIAWCAVLPDGRYVWIDEWPEWDPGLNSEPTLSENRLQYYLSPRLIPFEKIRGLRMSPHEFCEVVRAKEARIKEKYGLDVYMRFIDPRYSARSMNGKSTLRAQYAELGVRFEPAVAETELISGHSHIRRLLTAQYDDQGRVIQPPQMIFSDKCRNMIRHISLLSYPGKVKKGEYTGALSGKVDNSDPMKDFVDVARYLVQRHPYFILPRKDEDMDVHFDYWGKRRKPTHCYGAFQGL